MITTKRLLNPSSQIVNIFFVVIHFKIFFLGHFVVYNIAVLTIFTVLYIKSPKLIHLRTESLYLLTTFASVPLHPPINSSV